jgi:hypothetical protein
MPFTYCLDDGNAAGHRRLECHHHAHLLRLEENLVAVYRQQRLVGGDHVLAIVDSLQHQFPGHTGATDQLDNNINVRIAHHGERIVGDAALAPCQLLCTFEVLVRHHGDVDLPSGPALDFSRVALQHVESAAADGADAQQAYVDWFHTANLSVIVIFHDACGNTQGSAQCARSPQPDHLHWAGIPHGNS